MVTAEASFLIDEAVGKLVTKRFKALYNLVQKCEHIDKDNLLFRLEAETDDFIRVAEEHADEPGFADILMSRVDPRVIVCFGVRYHELNTFLRGFPNASESLLPMLSANHPLTSALIDSWKTLPSTQSLRPMTE